MPHVLPTISFRRWCGLLGGLWLLLPLLGWGQTSTVFSETFGTPGGTTSIATYATGTAPATFSSRPNNYTYGQGGAANPADIRATNASNNTGASGSGNTFFTSAAGEYGFAIAGINASSYTSLSLSFGLRKEAATAYTLVVDYSTDGTTYTPLAVAGLPGSTAAASWYGITGIAVPAAAQVAGLTLRFRKSGATGLRLDDIILTGTASAAATITTQDPTPAAVCADGASTLSVPYTVTSGTAAGTYAVQLSGAGGSFAAATTLATASTGSPLVVAIPATVAGGTGYLVRAVVGGSIASANPTPFTINNVAVAPTADQALATNAPGTPLTATETPAGTSRQWYYSPTSGSGYTTAIRGATGTSYAPNFAAAGTYYVVVQTNFGTCSVISNEVKVTVTAPGIATGSIAAGPYCVGQGAPAAVSIPFVVSGGAFAAGNVFTAYLVNSLGNIKLAIGTLAGTGSGTIAGSIAQAAGLVTRPDYRIQVEASSPAASALTDNGTDLSVASYLDNEVATATTSAGSTQATLAFAGPATCVTNVLVTIRAGSALGTKPTASGTYAPGAGGGAVAFGTGTVLSSGQYVVYNGPATGSITVTGLPNGSRYTFGIFTTNGGASGTTGYSDGATRGVVPVAPAVLTEVLVPQYLSGHATGSSTHPTRLPYVWRASLSSLAPGTTYKYYTAVRASTDASNYPGAGIPIETQAAGGFVRQNGPTLTNTSSTFTTDASGTYTGWFGLEPSADARFNDQAVVYPLVVLNGGDGLNVATQFLAISSAVTALNLSSAATGATGVRGSSFGTAGSFVLTYDNPGGTGRPLAGTWLENDGLASASTGTATYAGFYTGSVDGVAGTYGLLTPNASASGIRRVEQRALADGSLVGCAATSATGTWAGGAATASPSGGPTALVLSSGDAPLAAPTLTSLSASAIRPGQTLTLTGTGFGASPNATVTFAPGSTVAAASVSATGTSLTVVVPSGAGAGIVAVGNACGTSNPLATSLAPASAPGLLLFEDDFDYAAGQSLIGRGWSWVSTTQQAAFSTTAGNQLLTTYPRGAALSSLPAATSTQASLVANNAGPIYRSGARPAAATTLYAATVINVSNAQNSGDYFLAFMDATTVSSPTYRSRVFITKAGNFTGTYSFSLALSGTKTDDPAATEFLPNTPYLMVLKTETTTAGAETSSLYVLPAGADFSTEPTAPLISVSGPTSLSNPLNAVVLRQNGSNNATLTLDGIRLATGWGAAVGQPSFAGAGAAIAAGSYYSLAVGNGDVLTPTGGPVRVESSLRLGSGIIASTAAAPLTLYPGTSVAGGSATSYVSGPLVRATGTGAATTTFPIGSGANYRPLTLTSTAQASPATYTATQTEGDAGQSFSAANGLGTAPLLRVSTQRAYTLTTSNAGSGFTGTITLPFEPNDYVTSPPDAGLVIARRDAVAASPADNNRWTNLGRSASTGTGTGGTTVRGSLTSAPFSSFSDFTLGSTNADASINPLTPAASPLPVQLTSFAAVRSGGAVQVTWATASEKNSDYFVVERSLDGRTFAGLARVAAHGTTTLGHQYASLDAAAPAALLYYRLRQADLDGTVAFSPVVTVAAPAEALAEFTLAPNPARVSIGFLTAAPTTYTVRNPLGQLVRSGTTAAGPNTLLVSELPAGVYFFELHGTAGRVVRKFVKE